MPRTVELVTAGPLSDLARSLGLEEDDPVLPNVFPATEFEPRFDRTEYYQGLKAFDEGGCDVGRPLLGLAVELGWIRSSGTPDEEVAKGGLAQEAKVSDVNIDDAAYLLGLLPPDRVVHPQSMLRASSQPVDVSRLLSILAELALNPSFTVPIAKHFLRIMPDMMGRWVARIGLAADGTYAQDLYNLWPGSLPAHLRQDDPTGDAQMDDDASDERSAARREAVGAEVAKVFCAFSLLMDCHPGCFPFFVLLMRHPALSRDPLSLLPPAVTLGLYASESRLDLNHPLFTSPDVERFLMSLDRLLSVFPHLPFPGLVPNGWPLPRLIHRLARSHPKQGVRLLAWRCWRCWLGHNGFADLGESERAELVWRPPVADDGREPMSCPWAPWLDSSIVGAQGAFPEDFVWFGEEGTGDWELVKGRTGAKLVRSVRRRYVDAWILDPIRRADRNDHLRAVDSLGSIYPMYAQGNEANADVAPVIVRREHLSPFVVEIQGYVGIRESCLGPSSFPSDLGSPSAASTSGYGAASLSSTGLDTGRTFIAVPSSLTALRSVASHVSVRLPVLLAGPPSSGKSTLLEYIARHVRGESGSQRSLVVLNMAARTLDAKSILGSWASDPKEPGEFIFVEGPLVRAMKEGRWLLCEDLDKGAEDVLTVVNSVADRMRLRYDHTVGGAFGGHGGDRGVGIDLGSQGGWVPAAPGFALLATRTIRGGGAKFMGQQYWETVDFEGPRSEEVVGLVRGACPRLANVAHVLVRAWREVATLSEMWKGKSGFGRAVGLRDLLRWARRIENGLSSGSAIVELASNPVVQDEAFLEAVDVFLAPFPLEDDPSAAFIAAGRALGQHLGLGEERVTFSLRRRVPDFTPAPTASSFLTAGRVRLAVQAPPQAASRQFALTKPSRRLLEQIAAAVRAGESPLLVGETGTGKTAVTGYLAASVGKKLVAMNLSNQSEAGDLLGGFKPINTSEEARVASGRLLDEFGQLFALDFDVSRNGDFLLAARKAQAKKRWSRLVAMFREAGRLLSTRKASKAADDPEANVPPSKRRRLSKGTVPSQLRSDWQRFLEAVSDFEDRHARTPTAVKVRFSFVEGPLVNALRTGDWILLDEINLATPETLEAVAALLYDSSSSVVLSERGDIEAVPRHPDFRLFACMNPATDVGKRDLPLDLRSRFSEIYVAPPDASRDALLAIVQSHLDAASVGDKRVMTDVADFYTTVRQLAKSGQIGDGTNAPPHYSMRTLSRSLVFALDVAPSLGLRRALVEGLTMAFVTVLGRISADVVRALIATHIVEPARNPRAVISQQPRAPNVGEHIRVGPFHLAKGAVTTAVSGNYVVTPSVQTKLVDLARAAVTSRYPVLIQGPTSSGKTSIIEHLASLTGHRFVRINNHEHTDIQEYVGSYVADEDTGNLVFREGILVHALRHGEWIVLDELNLAPSDVLEGLNRLLDDNRELFISETQEVIRPHPHFMLFATQNPPGLYGGRKLLSRAFRNRFLELHFDDVPQDELEQILCQRCRIAPSYAAKIVAVFEELQRRRQADRVFEQRHSFVTLRDLFRWGARGAVGYQKLAEDGFMLIGERARLPEERNVVREVIESVMRVKIDAARLYAPVDLPPSLVPTSAARRLFALVSAALANHEPVLLVGHPGSGKTSIVEVMAAARGQDLQAVNLHQNTEVADLLGGQRPVRNRSGQVRAALALVPSAVRLELGVEDLDTPLPSDLAGRVVQILEDAWCASDVRESLEVLKARLDGVDALFTWCDGPVVQAMRAGALLLLDEISLADDSVLERLNSLLEPDRGLTLAERGGDSLGRLHLQAHPRFDLVATMNPGGDFGKKELSPALRNRFTEIWVSLIDEDSDREAILSARLSPLELGPWAARIVAFSSFFSQALSRHSQSSDVSLRDALAWCDFMLASALDPPQAFVQGARLALLDRLGATGFGQGLAPQRLDGIRADCLRHLERLGGVALPEETLDIQMTDSAFCLGPFRLDRRQSAAVGLSPQFSLASLTAARNTMRIMRALEVPKSVLLEGPPGVGKTSMVAALALLGGRSFYRINLSDQTDLLDLFGTDVPAEGGAPGEYVWRDAGFLHALKTGAWVLLDEMNLAPQSVLEGLNACLDHRGSVYLPELDQTFVRHPDFRVFAAQNPHHQGGGRKGLPRSFLDRFTVVHVDPYEEADLVNICGGLAPRLRPATVMAMVQVNVRLEQAVTRAGGFSGLGAPWEFNLRDLARWIAAAATQPTDGDDDGDDSLACFEFFDLVYAGRFRTRGDADQARRVFDSVFPQYGGAERQVMADVSPRMHAVGYSSRPRASADYRAYDEVQPNHGARSHAERLGFCLSMGWLPILAGPPASGKTTLVEQVAASEGRTLRSLVLGPGTDTSDLLGAFEQRRLPISLRRLADRMKTVLRATLAAPVAFASREVAQRTWLQLDSFDFSAGMPDVGVDVVSEAFATLRAGAEPHAGSALASIEADLQRCRRGLDKASFEWVDGPLVSAMKKGEWVILENANSCSASVLDRLNPLFEGAPSFVLSEQGMVDGQVPVVALHPDFRVVLSFDPHFGELSRAMRNRGIEIAFYGGHPRASPSCPSVAPPPAPTRCSGWPLPLAPTPLDDRCILLAACPATKLASAQRWFHHGVRNKTPSASRYASELLHASGLGHHQWSTLQGKTQLARRAAPKILDVGLVAGATDPVALMASEHASQVPVILRAALCRGALLASQMATSPARATLDAVFRLVFACAARALASTHRPDQGLEGLSRVQSAGEGLLATLFQSPSDFAMLGYAADALYHGLDSLPQDMSPESAEVKVAALALRHQLPAQDTTPLVCLWAVFCDRVRVPHALLAPLHALLRAARTSWRSADPGLRKLYIDVVSEILAGASSTVCEQLRVVRLLHDVSNAFARQPVVNNGASRLSSVNVKLLERAALAVCSLQPHKSSGSDLIDLCAESALSRPNLAVHFRREGGRFGSSVEAIMQLCMTDDEELDSATANASRLAGSILLDLTRSANLACEATDGIDETDRISEELTACAKHLAHALAWDPARRPTRIAQVYAQVLEKMSSASMVPTALPSTQEAAIDQYRLWTANAQQAAAVWRSLFSSHPTDPLAAATVQQRFLRAEWARRRVDQLDVAAFERAMCIRPTHRATLVEKVVNNVESRLDSLPRPPVVRRPSSERFLAVFEALRAFDARFMAGTLSRSLVDSASDGETRQLRNLSAAGQSLFRRLWEQYSDLGDVIEPIETTFEAVRLAMELRQHAAALARADLDGIRASALLLSPASSIAASELICSRWVLHAPAQRDALLLRASAAAAIPRACRGASFLDDVLRLYDDIWRLWSLDRRREERLTAERAQQFRVRGPVDFDGLDEDEEVALAVLFPSTEEALRLAEPSGQPPAGVHFRKEDATDINLLHRAIATRESGHETGFDARRFRVVAGSVGEKQLVAIDFDACAGLAALDHTRLAGASLTSAGMADFYRESNEAELKRALPILAALERDVVAITSAFPETPALDDLVARCALVRTVSRAAPLAQVVPRVEAIIAQLEDWQKLADREHSLASHLASLIALVVEWRRSELTSWSTLLAREANAFAAAADDWWFRIYELVVRGLGGHGLSDDAAEAHALLRDSAQALRRFMQEASIGQFKTRLGLLRSFEALLSPMATSSLSWTRAYQLLASLAFHYARFESEVDQRVAAANAVAKKTVDDLIRLASWKDVNIIALRQSSQRTHRSLLKVVRRFRSALQLPAEPAFRVIKGGATAVWTLAHPSSPVDFYDLTVPSESLLRLAEPPRPYLVDANTTLRRFESTARIVEAECRNDRPCARLSEVSNVIQETAATLQAATISGEGAISEKQAHNLDLRKRKAFADLLRELKRLGLSHSATERTLQQNSDVLAEVGRALLPDLDGRGFAVDFALAGLMDRLPQFRRVAVARHEDLSPADAQRAVFAVENGLASVLRDHQVLARALADLEAMRLLNVRLSAILKAPVLCRPQRRPAAVHAMQIAVHSALLEVFSKCRTLVSQDLLSLPASALASMEEATREASWSEQGLAKLVERTLRPLDIVSEEDVRLMEEASDRVGSARSAVERLSEECPGAAFIFRPLHEQLERVSADPTSPSSTPGPARASAVWTAHARLVDSVLLVAQRLRSLQSTDGPDRNEDGGLPKGALRDEHRRLVSCTNECHASDVRRAFASFCEVLSAGPAVVDALDVALARRAVGFMSAYLRLVEATLHEHLQWEHAFIGFLSTVVGVVTVIGEKGFCRPQTGEASEETQGEDGRTTDGMGMGEGTGGKDVSDQIEDESQMEGLQNEQAEGDQQQQAETQDKDKALDTKMDFDGEMEDVDEEEPAEGSEQNDEESEPDEAIGSVDPLDSQAVDEKLWQDKETEQNPPEKDTTDAIDGPQQPPDLTARTDERDAQRRDVDEGDPPPELSQSPEADGHDEAEGAQQEGLDHLAETEAHEDSKLDLPEDMQLDDERAEGQDDEDLLSEASQELEDGEGEATDDVGMQDDESATEEQKDDTGSANSKADGEGGEPDPAPAAAEVGHDSGDGLGEAGGDPAAAQQQGASQAQTSAFGTEGGPSMSSQARQTQSNGTVQDPIQPDQAPQTTDADPSAPGGAPEQKMEAGRGGEADEQAEVAMTSDTRRRLADSLESWRQRLTAIGDPEEAAEAEAADPAATAPDLGAAAEFTREEGADGGRATGPATAEQAQQYAAGEGDTDDTVTMEDLPRQVPEQAPAPTPTLDFGVAMDVGAPDVKTEAFEAAKGVMGHEMTGPARERMDWRNEPDEGVEAVPDDSPGLVELERELDDLRSPATPADAADIWRTYERHTQSQAFRLAEQLRLVLEPTTATRLQGDYRTGKRLNMRKIVPYIASDFTKDKIWLRRTRPAQRDYQILLAIDDSRSMADSRSAQLAFQTLALVTRGLSLLQAGDVSVVRFGGSVDVVRPFGQTATVDAEAGGRLIREFSFAQQKTDVRLLVDRALHQFEQARETAASSAAELWQLGIIVSDGVCQDHEAVRALMRKAYERRVLFVFVVLDSLHQRQPGAGEEAPSSIADMTSVSYVAGATGALEMRMERYLDSFPFDFYIILRDVSALPDVLTSTLRQFFERVSSS